MNLTPSRYHLLPSSFRFRSTFSTPWDSDAYKDQDAHWRSLQTFWTMFSAPIDGSLTFPQLIDTFLQKEPTEIYAILVPPSGDGPLLNISWAEFARAIHRGAHMLNPIINGIPRIPAGNVVGIYAVTDTLLYVTLILSVIRSGNIVRSILSKYISVLTLTCP